MYEYRIYLYREFCYELEETTYDETRIDYYIQKKDKDYARLLVIKHDIFQDIDYCWALKFFDSDNVKKRQRKPEKRWKKLEIIVK